MRAGEVARGAAGTSGSCARRRGIVLLPRRWVVECSFAWTSRFRRLVKDCERLPQTLVGLHLVAFTTLMLTRMLKLPLGANA